jgi:hypothetical protein
LFTYLAIEVVSHMSGASSLGMSSKLGGISGLSSSTAGVDLSKLVHAFVLAQPPGSIY